MKEIIERLDKWMKEHRRKYYENLNPGLSGEEIQDWEDKFGFKLPEDFRMLYKWKNGQSDKSRENFFDFCFFDEIETVYEQWEFGCDDLIDFNEDDMIAWGETWLRFMSLLNDDGYCLDVNGDLGEPGSIVYYLHDGENEVVYTSLKKMMEMIVHLFELGVYGYKEIGGNISFEVIDREKSDKILDEFME